MSEEVVEQEDTPSPLANQNSNAKVPLKTSEEEKEKEQVEEDRQVCCAIVESELDQKARGSSLSRKKRKPGQTDCSNKGCKRVAFRRGLCKPCAYGKKTPSSRKTGQPDCSNKGCKRVKYFANGLCRPCGCGTKKCIVPGCTANALDGGRKKCSTHQYPCSVPGCNKQGAIVSDNGTRLCRDHAETLAPDENNRRLDDRPRCSVPGCNRRGEIASDNGTFCHGHARTEAPEAHAQRRRNINRRNVKRYQTDPKYRARVILRRRLNLALRRAGTSYQGKLGLIGCTVDQINRYLEQFFSENGYGWMNWDNQGSEWEIDHIMPLSSFDLTNPEELRRANHWSNFQPLSLADNRSKGNTIPVGFEWNGDRWMWSEASGRTNYELPAVGAEDVTIDELFEEDDESDEFDGSGDENDE